ncbi:NAD-dependent protein deacetylase sirtuin-7 isoform X2 [Caretta caretta]|uniref:NAD-dependent protein deacetylase sirtuin-7 isoform X2 n=1 Tax=Caretta caretta TaxID=8467 RepID=UPI0020946040|nr:NAD-dependent protein deacetylase sirtuin-7 isoform X2 [Caretta caretta]
MAAGGSLSRAERKAAARAEILQQEEQRDRRRQVSRVLRKPAGERSPEESLLLGECEDIVRELERRRMKREGLRRRQEEVCDEPEELKRKVIELAAAVRSAKHLVIYTGAGISTAASIPDYRGPNGVWTLLQKGRSIRATDLSEAEPTLTHMSIACLHKHNLVQHVVSQNCDGLHLRSGLPQAAISELHGNMYIEVLKKYPRLWCMSKPPSRRPKLYIVNLQWTPKDDLAALKLHGKCDDVMRLLMEELGLEIPCYDRTKDPIFSLAIPLGPGEEGSHSRRPVAPPWSLEEAQMQEQQREPASQLSLSLSGGWFGRGCAKGSKKKKVN